jgi:hypothetical protein
MNEGDYLELVNDLKVQYDSMKERYQKRIAFLEQNNKDMKILLGKMHPLRFATNQFCSPRPTGRIGVYGSTHSLHLMHCPVCSRTHPQGHTCA